MILVDVRTQDAAVDVPDFFVYDATRFGRLLSKTHVGIRPLTVTASLRRLNFKAILQQRALFARGVPDCCGGTDTHTHLVGIMC